MRISCMEPMSNEGTLNHNIIRIDYFADDAFKFYVYIIII